jgi:hypothetical protein
MIERVEVEGAIKFTDVERPKGQLQHGNCAAGQKALKFLSIRTDLRRFESIASAPQSDVNNGWFDGSAEIGLRLRADGERSDRAQIHERVIPLIDY